MADLPEWTLIPADPTDAEKAADQMARWMENPEESLRVLRDCLLAETRKCDELVRQRDAATEAERKRCLAALCSYCADGLEAKVGFPGDETAGYPAEYWHHWESAYAVRCLAAPLRHRLIRD